MPTKRTGPGDEYREIDRFDGGVGWIAHPDERMQRASHALVGDEGGVWVVDPVDAAGLDDLLVEFGEVAGVVVLFGWHARDAGRIARRHDVAVHLPAWVDRVPGRVDAPVRRFSGELAGSGFRALRVADGPGWREAALRCEGDGTLVVPESLGAEPYFAAPGERVGVTLYRRPLPPRDVLGDLSPERLLFGHGPGVHDDAGAALAEALAGARRRLPAALVANLPTQLRTLWAAMGD